MKSIRVTVGIVLALSSSGLEAKSSKKASAVKSTVAIHAPYFQKQEPGITFPSGFLKGVSYSTYQNSGHNYWPSLGYRPQSNWTHHETYHRQRFFIDRKGKKGKFPLLPFQSASPIDRGEKVGIAADTWSRLFDDIALMKALNINAVRFELPWTDLNPELGRWNEEAFDLFDRYIDALIANGIEPMITLYHWVHPLWFQKMGGWEHEKNSVHFVNFCTESFRRFGHKVPKWITINEPSVLSACGYILGSHAPGKQTVYVPGMSYLLRKAIPGYAKWCKKGFRRAGIVLGNLLKVHNDVYAALKGMPHGDKVQISLVHQMALFEGPSYNPAVPEMSALFAHNVVMNFFKTGHYYYLVPGGQPETFYDERAPRSLDFFGLNFYATVTLNFGPNAEKGETMADMVWAIRPHSLYEALKEVATLGVPIIITENGIPDARDNRREKWIVGNMNAVKKAVDEGVDVRGFYYWSLLDNFEWNMGHNKKFGLYEVDTLSNDPNKKERRLRKGAEIYRDYVIVPDVSENAGSESICQSASALDSNSSSMT